ncbi:hypothetical protein IDM40_01860 [Nocardiopsis sp. HNM0947]|uniref:Uncharacterized protein n=1 Tax=Nocardiopsis coralli TaxID=2772213 RepID=A0ABR9P0U6_9ACTN|nr:hypothetical protein [Nocardiopsis coralli]MBE2997454.1 hypothetical protein [Nocardiopsis coralli]
MSNENDTPIQHGKVDATYFWDDGSGIGGDTGLPAGGEPMQKGLFSSPSWPLGTEGYIEYEGQTAEFFIGDRGPGHPSNDCDILLDLDGQTFAELTGQTWDEENYVVSGGNGHLYDVEYYITEWGDGDGEEGAPHPFQQPENKCEDAVSEIPEEKLEDETSQQEEEEAAAQAQAEEEAAEQEAAEQEAAAEAEAAEKAEAEDEKEEEESGVTAETAANDVSGFQLTGADGDLAGGGILILAIIPAILLAVGFAWFRRPAGAHAGAADTDGKGLMADGEGKHGHESWMDRLRGNNDD